jgi:hypothetical protein
MFQHMEAAAPASVQPHGSLVLASDPMKLGPVNGSSPARKLFSLKVDYLVATILILQRAIHEESTKLQVQMQDTIILLLLPLSKALS